MSFFSSSIKLCVMSFFFSMIFRCAVYLRNLEQYGDGRCGEGGRSQAVNSEGMDADGRTRHPCNSEDAVFDADVPFA